MPSCESRLIVPLSILALLRVVAAQPVVAAEPLATITVEAGKYTRVDTPVSISLEGVSMGRIAGAIRLVEMKDLGPVTVPMQMEPDNGARLCWILSGTTPAGGKRTYQLIKGAVKPPTVEATVEVTKNDSFLQIQRGRNKILRYNHAIVPPPEGQSELFSRSGFIHPLWSPSGDILTNIHPSDHIHHVGIWMPWTHTKFEGKDVDFWNLNKGEGTVRFVRFLSTTSGPVYGGFQAEQEHVVLKTDQGEKVVLREVWDVRVYNVGGPRRVGFQPTDPDGGASPTLPAYWLLDFKSTQRCVADSPLHQIQYRYGGFGFRGAAEWEGENAAYLTSEGRTRKDGHATRARWCDASGAINGKWAGVTHLSHPENFRHPEPMRIWPSGQVFFNWAPSQAGDWVMEPGEDHIFRYRLYVHEGKVKVADSERFWRDFAEPPVIRLEPVRPENAIVLFDGTDSSHWTHTNGKSVQWKIIGDAMKIVPGTGSIVTKREFRDFQLHVEFKTPQLPPDVRGQARGNSGVYLQRRYEVQILDSFGLPPGNNECGALYRVRAPDKNVCKQPGQWQTFDIAFHAARFEGDGKNATKVKNARITVRQNGVLIHDDVEIPKKTGAGRPEGPEPGPILLQDHRNEVEFGNIWIVSLNE